MQNNFNGNEFNNVQSDLSTFKQENKQENKTIRVRRMNERARNLSKERKIFLLRLLHHKIRAVQIMVF